MNVSAGLPIASDSHNLAGQKIGRKGRETRERILAAFLRRIDDPDGPPVTLTSVAREAGVRLPNVYVYFPDIGNLLLAGLARVIASDEDGYLQLLRHRWPDAELEQAALAFLRAHLAFWKRNARLLHMRNAIADAGDGRVMEWRNLMTRPLIGMLIKQMDGSEDSADDRCMRVATVLMTGIERLATVVTNPRFEAGSESDFGPASLIEELIDAEAEVVAQAIAHRRRLA